MTSLKKTVEIVIQSVDSIIYLNVKPYITGQELIDMIFEHEGITEKHWFCLQYIDRKQTVRYFDLKQKIDITSITLLPDSYAHFKFLIKYYPESLKKEVVTLSAKMFFFKSEMLKFMSNSSIYILPNQRIRIAVAYASYISKFVLDVTPGRSVKKEFDKNVQHKSLIKLNLTQNDSFDSIMSSILRARPQHQNYILMQAFECIEKGSTYGIFYYRIENTEHIYLLLGVNCFGLNIYKQENRIKPEMSFSFDELDKVKNKGRKFIIKPYEKNSRLLVFYTQSAGENEEMTEYIRENMKRFKIRRLIRIEPDRKRVHSIKSAKSISSKMVNSDKAWVHQILYEDKMIDNVSNSISEENLQGLNPISHSFTQDKNKKNLEDKLKHIRPIVEDDNIIETSKINSVFYHNSFKIIDNDTLLFRQKNPKEGAYLNTSKKECRHSNESTIPTIKETVDDKNVTSKETNNKKSAEFNKNIQSPIPSFERCFHTRQKIYKKFQTCKIIFKGLTKYIDESENFSIYK